ncbi:MAG: TonB-dependent receptor plug domain-containing protein [Candidatus Cloacimonas sp.]
MKLQKLFPLIILCYLSTNLFGTAKQDSLKTYNLPTVYVVVEKPSEAIGSLHTIESEDVKTSLSLREAMQNSVGISATTGSKDESNLRLRGFRKNEIKIMVDGRPLNNGYFGNVDINKLSLLNIEEIQILKGPASPLYGTNNMGGVVNIITKAPPKNNWLELNTIFKRNQTCEINLASAHSFDSWNYRIGLSREQTDGFVLSQNFTPTSSENGGIRNNSDNCLYNLSGSLTSDLLNFHNIGIDFGYSTMDKKNIPSSIYEHRYRQYQDWMRYNSGVWTKFRLQESSVLNLQFTYDYSADRYLEYSDPMYETNTLDSSMHNQAFGIHSRFTKSFANNRKLELGYNYELQINRRKDDGSYLEWTYSPVHLHQLFSQYESYLLPDLLLTTGLGLSAGLNKYHTEFNPQWEPAIGISYDSFFNGKTSFAIGRNTSQPTMRQLYSESKGNPALKPQNSLKIELSHNQALLHNKLSLFGSVYYNDTKDLIDLYRGRYENIYKVKSQGAEIGMDISLLKFWQSSVSYAYLSYQENSDYYLTETPKNSVDLTQRFKLPYNANFNIYSSFRDKRLSQDDEGRYHNLAVYWKHNLLLTVPYKQVELSLGVENILDENYQCEYGFPEPGRNYSLGLQIKI